MTADLLSIIDLIVCSVQILMLATLAALSVRAARSAQNGMPLMLLAWGYACYFLGDLFYVLHLWLVGNFPFVFSAADLSYLGLYCFWISIDLTLINTWTDAQRQASQRYRLIAWLGPVVTVLFHIAYTYIYPDIWLSNLIYCIALSPLSYYTLFLLRASGKRSAWREWHDYQGAMLAFLVVELLMFLMSSFGYYAPGIVLEVLLCVTVALVFIGAKKGAGA